MRFDTKLHKDLVKAAVSQTSWKGEVVELVADLKQAIEAADVGQEPQLVRNEPQEPED